MRLVSIIIFLFIFSVSCEKKSKHSTTSAVDYNEVDTFFGDDVSKLLFDHLYIVLDSVSYAELTQNEFFNKNYVSIDEGLPNFKAVDQKTTTCYLRGHQHYIEILGPNNQFKEPIGKSGIGFSLQNKGEHFHLGL